MKLVTQLKTIDDVVRLAEREGSPVIFAIKTTVKTIKGELKEIKHSVIAMRLPGGSVKFADYGGKFFPSLKELVARWGVPLKPIELYSKPGGASAAAVGGPNIAAMREAIEMLGEFGTRLQQGAVIVLVGMEAVEIQDEGVDIAFPATFVATPTSGQGEESEVITESFDNFVRRKDGAPLRVSKPKKAPILMEPVEVKGGAPRADWLTGVQFRLNHLGFGAGPVDGIMGPITEAAVRAFQKLYPPLRVDGIPGPRTQAKLAEVCGY